MAHFFDLLIDETSHPTLIYRLEKGTQTDVALALSGHTDRYWEWLCQATMRRSLVIASPGSWGLTISEATNLLLKLGTSYR